MSSDSVLTDDEVYRSEAIKDIFENIKDMTNNIKQKITLDEEVPNKQKWWAYLDEINRFIDNQL